MTVISFFRHVAELVKRVSTIELGYMNDDIKKWSLIVEQNNDYQ